MGVNGSRDMWREEDRRKKVKDVVGTECCDVNIDQDYMPRDAIGYLLQVRLSGSATSFIVVRESYLKRGTTPSFA